MTVWRQVFHSSLLAFDVGKIWVLAVWDFINGFKSMVIFLHEAALISRVNFIPQPAQEQLALGSLSSNTSEAISKALAVCSGLFLINSGEFCQAPGIFLCRFGYFLSSFGSFGSQLLCVSLRSFRISFEFVFLDVVVTFCIT